MVLDLKHQVKKSLSLFAAPSSSVSRRKRQASSYYKRQQQQAAEPVPLWSSATASAPFNDTNGEAWNSTSSTATPLSTTISPRVPPWHLPAGATHFGTTVAGPTALLVGGTAVLYQSLLQGSSLTPLAILYMVLLAVQTSLQPRLSRTYIPKHIPKVQVALTEEVIKTTVAAAAIVLLSGSSGTPLFHNNPLFQDWTLTSSLVVAGVPAVLYALQGILTYQAHQHLDSVTVNGLSQTKTLWAAVCCYFVMAQRQSPLQMVALGGLWVAALLFQQQQKQQPKTLQNIPEYAKETSVAVSSQQPTAKSTATSVLEPASPAPLLGQTTEASDASKRWHRYTNGIVPCLAATFLSGLAGAFSQRGLQMVGGTGRNAFLYTVEVSFFSAVTLLVMTVGSTVCWGKNNYAGSVIVPAEDNSTTTTTNEASWPWQTYIPIATKAMGGILTALVHKHAGSVVKGFALMLGLVMSAILQSLWGYYTFNAAAGNSHGTTKSPTSLPRNQVAGIVIVMVSSWLHFTNPPV